MQRRTRLLVPVDIELTVADAAEVRRQLEEAMPAHQVIVVRGMRGSAVEVHRTVAEALA